MNKRLKEILQRKAEIRSSLESTEKVDLDAFEQELRELDEEYEAIEKREKLMQQAEQINNGELESRTISTFNMTGNPDESDTLEQRQTELGTDLLEKRTVTVSTGDIVLPVSDSATINPSFNQISSLLDAVNTVPLTGGESHKQPYEKSHGEAGYTAEGENYTDVETTTGYAEINKAKITAYSEHSEEVEKLPAANYAQNVQSGVGKSLRRKITRQILVGEGGNNEIVGIFSDKATAIEASTDKEIATIDASTLDEIIFSYGGDEDVEDTAVLILNKADVKAFATLRTNDGKKVYDVKSSGNTGTIDGVPYIINSACKALSTASTGDYVMAYGPLSNYELAVFSPTDIQRSTEFKFKQGIIAHRGSVFLGGNVVAHNGFLRVKKAAAI